MAEKTDIADQLRLLLQPYFGRGSPVDLDAKFAADLGITGTDYLDLIADIERSLGTDLHDFLIGSDPEYLSTGLAGMIIREPEMPIYRDVSASEILEFLQAR